MEICRIALETVPEVFPDCEVITIPIADGGEGTAECYAAASGAEMISLEVSGPFGEKVQAVYAKNGTDAVIEMAQAAGLTLAEGRFDPVKAGTFGVGELIRDAVQRGSRQITVGIGGSATNDGGCGCAAALGVRFYDQEGAEFIPTGGTLGQICSVDCREAQKFLKDTTITVMCDVENPLYGPKGAAYVFAPQKGADPETVRFLDSQLRSFDTVLKKELGCSVAELPGSGAAGGMGAGLRAFFHAEMRSGIETFLDLTGFDEKLAGADLVFTGEGRIDSQSIHGKVISGIASRTSKKNIPLIAIVGGIDDSASEAYEIGVSAIFSINRNAADLRESAPKSAENYRRTLFDILCLIKSAENI